MKLSHSKKLNQKMREVTTELSQQLKAEFNDFIELEYNFKLDNFPSSILILCHFKKSNTANVNTLAERRYQTEFHKLMFKRGILIKTPTNHLKFK